MSCASATCVPAVDAPTAPTRLGAATGLLLCLCVYWGLGRETGCGWLTRLGYRKVGYHGVCPGSVQGHVSRMPHTGLRAMGATRVMMISMGDV